jgi:hypothetical protein
MAKKSFGVKMPVMVLMVLFQSCGTLIPLRNVEPPHQKGQINTVKEFALSTSTKVAVKVDKGLGVSDSSEVATALEDALLGLGLSVAPYDVAVSVARTDVSVETNENSASGSAIAYKAKYFPAAIVISPIYNVMPSRQMGGDYIAGVTFRIMDLSTDTLLASFRYQYSDYTMNLAGQVTATSGQTTIRDFVTDFKEYLKEWSVLPKSV